MAKQKTTLKSYTFKSELKRIKKKAKTKGGRKKK